MTATDRLAAVAATYFETLFPGRAAVAETHGSAILTWLAEPAHRSALVAWLAVLGVDLADPANRDALVAGLVDAGVLAEAGVWDQPEVDEDAMNEAKDRYYRENQQRIDDAAAGFPWKQEEVDAMIERARTGWHDRRRIVDGPRFYFDGDDRPEGSVPLLRIGDGRG